MESMRTLKTFQADFSKESGSKDEAINSLIAQMYLDMNDDFNVPKTLASVFELCTIINSVKDGHISADAISVKSWNELIQHLDQFVFEIFGLKDENDTNDSNTIEHLMKLVIELRKTARENKDWSSSDKIRDMLKEAGIQLKDGKDGTEWMHLN